MAMYDDCSYPSSARGTRLRSPICCFRGIQCDTAPSTPETRSPRSPYEWLKSTAHDLEIRDRCRRVKARIKGSCRNRVCNHHHHGSVDFSYDPLSYALNFEDDVRADEDEAYRSFTARLPNTPQREVPATLRGSIAREMVQAW